MQKSKGEFQCDNVEWAYHFDPAFPNGGKGDAEWKKIPMSINSKGELQAHGSVVIVPNVQQCILGVYPKNLVLRVGITTQKVLYFRLPSYTIYSELLSCLMAWQNMRPEGIASKWNYNRSIVYDKHFQANDILVCRFKVYGPLPTNKKVKVLDKLPQMPVYQPDSDSETKEGWFVAIGHLLPNGTLNLLCESDGSLLYSVRLSTLFSSEVRLVHHSIAQTSNVLFLGFINELRILHGSTDDFNSNGSFLVPPKTANSTEAKRLTKVTRILIDFDLRMDLEDWLVAISSITNLEYVGNVLYNRRLRIVRNVDLEVLEATFEDKTLAKRHPHVYCELQMWGAPWFRTSVVDNSSTSGCFWKESMELRLPPGTDYFKILIKGSKDEDMYDSEGVGKDDTIGACFITPNFFTEDQFLTKIPIFDSENVVLGQLTINLSVDEVHVLPYRSYRVLEKMLLNMDIGKLVKFIAPLTDSSHLEPWSIMLLDVFQTLHKEHDFFNSLMKQELASIDTITRTHRISRSSVMSGGSSSIEVPSPTSAQTTLKKASAPSFNTIFRGNSMLSKTLEKYDIRVGQEYLEKLLGPFIQQIVNENKDCECDPKNSPDHYKENYQNLLGYLEKLWHRIYITSNDLPAEMRREWKNLRRNVELSVEPNDQETPLNALSAFIFLRFLCPAILNPQLFNLTKAHHPQNISRTLTLIAKVMMVFANRSTFQQHKDPSLMDLNNDFINKHKEEILTYFDRVTGCKMDFNEKILDLSNLNERLSLNTSKQILNELPTMPYLIDKYMSLTKLCQILYDQTHPDGPDERFLSKESLSNPGPLGIDDSELGTGEFLKNLLDEDDEEFSNILFKRDFSMKELSDQATVLIEMIQRLDAILERPEVPREFTDESWTTFVESCMRSVRLTKDGTILFDPFISHNLDLVATNVGTSNSLNTFLKVISKTPVSSGRSSATHHHERRNVFKKWFRHR